MALPYRPIAVAQHTLVELARRKALRFLFEVDGA